MLRVRALKEPRYGSLLLMVEVVVEVVVLVVQIRPGERANIPSFLAVEVCHSPQSACANDDAPENISCMSVTLDTSQLDMLTLNDDAPENIFPILVTLDTSHLAISPLNDGAEKNMSFMLVTLDTSHVEILTLNDDAE